MRDTQAGPKRKRILDGQDLVSQVDTGTLSQAVIAHKLADHVESVDADMVCNPSSAMHSVGTSAHIIQICGTCLLNRVFACGAFHGRMGRALLRLFLAVWLLRQLAHMPRTDPKTKKQKLFDTCR